MCIRDSYRVAQKLAPFLYTLTCRPIYEPNINRFSNLFYCQNQEKICDNTITKDPITFQVCRYTTLWNVKCLKTWRQSLFCCCTECMEQAADGAETAAIDGLVSSWSENISASFCLRAPGYRLTLWCALGLLVGGAIQVPQLQLHIKIVWIYTY